jgi:hypothetical protein
MNLNIFQIIVLCIVFYFIYILWIKYGISYFFNYFLGIIFIIAYNVIWFQNESVIFLIINFLVYTALHISSLIVNFYNNGLRKGKFFLFSIILYCVFIFIEICLVDPFKYFRIKFLCSLFPVFIAFFPLYVLLYKKMYKNNNWFKLP